MALAEISSVKYGRLLAKALPKVIETKDEFRHYVETMEQFGRRAESGLATPEEVTLLNLLEQLIQDYDDRVELPELPPHKLIAYLMEWRGLRQADLLPVFGSRSVASEVLNGKREPSKAHIRKLAEFFRVSPELFL